MKFSSGSWLAPDADLSTQDFTEVSFYPIRVVWSLEALALRICIMTAVTLFTTACQEGNFVIPKHHDKDPFT